MQNHTKIVATIGPASEKKETLEKMILQGVDLCRLNFSHGTHSNHFKLIKNIRACEKKLKKPIAIIQDLQGPRIRIGNIGKNKISVKKNKKYVFSYHWKKQKNILPVTHKDLYKDLKPGDRMLLNDGLLEMTVLDIKNHDIFAEAKGDGQIETHGGINLPDTILNISALTEKDKKDVEFGISKHVDYIALSFVTSASDIFDLRYLIEKVSKQTKTARRYPIKIIAKIEKHEAVTNIDEIIDAADAGHILGNLIRTVLRAEKEAVDRLTATAAPRKRTENANPRGVV